MEDDFPPADYAMPVGDPGELCDECPGDSGQAERAAQMASAIVPVCKCATGRGAPPGKCRCGKPRPRRRPRPIDTAERFAGGTGVHW